MRYYARSRRSSFRLMADRPLVLKRFPNGIDGTASFSRRPARPPDGVRVETIETQGGSTNLRIVGGDLYTLLYTVQLGAISVDPWHSRIQSLDFADYTIIDLDPGPRATFERVIEVARWVKEALDQLGLHGGSQDFRFQGAPYLSSAAARTLRMKRRRSSRRSLRRKSPKHIRRKRRSSARLKRAARRLVYVDYLQNIIGKTVARRLFGSREPRCDGFDSARVERADRRSRSARLSRSRLRPSVSQKLEISGRQR